MQLGMIGLGRMGGNIVRRLMKHGHSTVVYDKDEKAVAGLAADGALGIWPVWRIVCPPASGGALGEALARDTGGDVLYDWGGGLLWAALPPKPDAQAAVVRQRVDAVGGHATLIRAAEVVRRHVDVFHPQHRDLAGLGERVRHGFDPRRILNRGRLTRSAGA